MAIHLHGNTTAQSTVHSPHSHTYNRHFYLGKKKFPPNLKNKMFDGVSLWHLQYINSIKKWLSTDL